MSNGKIAFCCFSDNFSVRTYCTKQILHVLIDHTKYILLLTTSYWYRKGNGVRGILFHFQRPIHKGRYYFITTEILDSIAIFRAKCHYVKPHQVQTVAMSDCMCTHITKLYTLHELNKQGHMVSGSSMANSRLTQLAIIHFNWATYSTANPPCSRKCRFQNSTAWRLSCTIPSLSSDSPLHLNPCSWGVVGNWVWASTISHPCQQQPQIGCNGEQDGVPPSAGNLHSTHFVAYLHPPGTLPYSRMLCFMVYFYNTSTSFPTTQRDHFNAKKTNHVQKHQQCNKEQHC